MTPQGYTNLMIVAEINKINFCVHKANMLRLSQFMALLGPQFFFMVLLGQKKIGHSV